MILAGQPINDPEQDVLGRRKLAVGIAEAIAGYSDTSSLVVALYGTWGTGKTSLLNMVMRSLPRKDETEQSILTVVQFNPWNYSDQNQLLTQFFDSLSMALKRPDLAGDYDELRELLQALKQRAKPFTFVPGLDRFIEVAGKAVDIVSKGLSEAAEDARDLVTIKGEISRLLVENKTRLLVVIDDIDRLTSTEIRQVFQLVKSVADFKNVTYLLAFDRDIVSTSLSTVQSGTGTAYLEKIINVPIEVPPIRQPHMHQIIVQRINESIANDLPAYDWNNERLAEGIFTLSRAFTTIRQVDRFANLLAFSASLIRGNLDYTDFVLLTGLQILSPGMYYFVRNHPAVFVDTPETIMLSRDDADAKANQEVINKATQEHFGGTLTLEQARNYLALLFPKVEWQSGRRRPSDEEAKWRRERRICANLTAFETYFQLDVPTDDVPKADLEALLDRLDRQSLTDALLGAISQGNGIAFLERLLDYADDSRVVERADVIVEVLINDGDRFETDMRGFPIRLDGPTLIMQLVYRILRRRPVEEERYQILRRAIENATNGVYVAAKIVSVEDQTHGRYNLGGSRDVSKSLVSAAHLDHLEKVTLGKIETCAHAGMLGNLKELPYLLFRWLNWAGKEAVENYIVNDLSDEQLVKFLAYFVGHPEVTDPDNPDAINWRLLDELVTSEGLQARVKKIANQAADESRTRVKEVFLRPRSSRESREAIEPPARTKLAVKASNISIPERSTLKGAPVVTRNRYGVILQSFYIINEGSEATPEITHLYILGARSGQLIPCKPKPGVSVDRNSRNPGDFVEIESFNLKGDEVIDSLSRQYPLPGGLRAIPPIARERLYVRFLLTERDSSPLTEGFILRVHCGPEIHDFAFRLFVRSASKRR